MNQAATTLTLTEAEAEGKGFKYYIDIQSPLNSL